MNNRSKFLLLLVLLLSFQSFAQEHKQVLLISSYNSRFPTYFQQINGIKSVLDTTNFNVNLDVEFMDSKRFINLETQTLFFETLKNKLIQSEKYDAIITADDNAFNFVLNFQDDLFKKIPIVFLGVNNVEKAIEQNLNTNVTGVIEAVSMKETIDLMINLFPETKSVYCLTDGTSSGQSDLKLFRQTAMQFPNIDCKEINLSNLTFLEYKEQLKEIPANAPVLLLSAYLDKMQQTIDFDNTIDILQKNLNAPLFHLYEHGMGEGILGGKLISHYQQGEKAATMVYRILSGESISSIKVLAKSPNIFQFDFNQLKKHKIALSTLPLGTKIINQPISFFQKHKRIIYSFLIILGLLLLLIFVLSANILKRRKIEIQLKNQNLNFSKLNQELLTANHKAEEEEQKFKQLFYEHAAIKLLIDAETGQIFDVNYAASSYYGWSKKEFTQMNISDINTLSLSEIANEMDHAKKTEKVHFEFKHRKADGTIQDVEVFTSYVTISGKQYLYSIIHDVNEKKKQEHKIKLLSRSIEQSPATILITDKEGKIEYVNPAFTQITGYSLEEVIGKNPQILKSNNTCSKLYNQLWETILSGKTWIGELQNKKASGELYWVNNTISPIYNNKTLTNFVAVCEDITAKKKNIEELIIAKNKAEEANNLKTEFLHNMSHEIRTPMNGIIGFSELLNNESLDKEKQQKFKDIIIKSSYQLLSIIDDILEISRLETRQVSIHKETFSLNTFLSELHLLFTPKMEEKGLSFLLRTALDNENSYINTDKAKINGILINLIQNALKFTHKGSVELGYFIEKNQVCLYVKDTGIGISSKNIHRIFDRFAQEEKELSQKYGGLGLGLAISKENACLINGEIRVESKKNIGSTFYVTIPFTVSENSQESVSIVAEKIDTKENHTILVAEDEEINFLFIKTLLQIGFNSNINVIRAANGEEAINACAKHPDIDIVLMDIKMPVMNGLEATKKIKLSYPNLPIIAVTAYSTESDKIQALSFGCDAFISKPINKAELFQVIKKYLGNK